MVPLEMWVERFSSTTRMMAGRGRVACKFAARRQFAQRQDRVYSSITMLSAWLASGSGLVVSKSGQPKVSKGDDTSLLGEP